jgi:hypothetical protein
VAGPVERWLDGLDGTGNVDGAPRFGVVFCDPPYAFGAWLDLLARLPAGLVVVESGGPVPLPAGWGLARQARYGGTWVGFAEPG